MERDTGDIPEFYEAGHCIIRVMHRMIPVMPGRTDRAPVITGVPGKNKIKGGNCP